MIPILTNIFETGWNHQPAYVSFPEIPILRIQICFPILEWIVRNSKMSFWSITKPIKRLQF